MRGEVLATLAGGDRKLCLTLGALAEIETALGTVGLDSLAERMRRLSAGDLQAVLGALLRGGGEIELADRLPQAAVNPKDAMDAIARTFAAAT